MKKAKSLYHGHRFPAAAFSCAVRLYFRFQLSVRDIEEPLFELRVIMTYETIRCWCDKFGRGFAHRARAALRKPGSAWHRAEMLVTLRGEPYLLWRAADEHGAELDIMVQKRRDRAAGKGFFKHVLRSSPVPRKIVTDQLRSYPAAKAEIPELANVKHEFVKAAAWLHNRSENNHEPTAEREGRVRGSRDPKHTELSLVLRAKPATFRPQAPSAARFTLLQTALCPICCLARIYRNHQKSVGRFLTSRRPDRRDVLLSAS